jgi:hypothetical protein
MSAAIEDEAITLSALADNFSGESEKPLKIQRRHFYVLASRRVKL